MQEADVFCFDFTVATLWAKYHRGFPVLIHDSSFFADVDPRQYAGALKLAAECSAKYGLHLLPKCWIVADAPSWDLRPYSFRSLASHG
jgi:uncharacterized protein YydD (DUF2326 family)